MLKQTFILLILIIVSNLSCNQNEEVVSRYSNGSIRIGRIRLNNDTMDYKMKEYYINGNLKSIYFIKSGKREGYNREYYNDGKVKSEGEWMNDKMVGDFKVYYPSGELQSVLNYIPFRDSNVNRPNQMLKFDVKGDTLWNQSMYYEVKRVSNENDTVKFGNLYVFNLKLKGHVFEKTTFVYICNFDKDYNFIPGKPRNKTTLEMKDFAIGLGTKADKYGWNYIRGYIENTTWSPENPSLPVTKVQLYFTDSFYVIK